MQTSVLSHLFNQVNETNNYSEIKSSLRSTKPKTVNVRWRDEIDQTESATLPRLNKAKAAMDNGNSSATVNQRKASFQQISETTV